MLLNHWGHGDGGIPMPVGAIFGLDSAETLPAELSEFSSYNGRLVRGTGTDSHIKTTGGSNSVSGNTTTNGSHATQSQGGVYDIGHVGHPNEHQCTLCETSATGHAHSYTANYYPAKCRVRLVRVNTAVKTMPSGAVLFSHESLDDLTKYSTFNSSSGLLSAYTSCSTSGATTSGSIGTASDWHNHTYSATGGHYEIFAAYSGMTAGGGAHSHSWSASFSSFSPKKAQLIAWKLTEELRKKVGRIIVMYDQAGVPDGWALCNGTNGTPNLVDYFVGFGETYSAGSGGNTISVSGGTGSNSHSHTFSGSLGTIGCTIIGHSSSVSHSHTVSGSHGFAAPWFKLKFIMYNG